jgi:hypothetical protein
METESTQIRLVFRRWVAIGRSYHNPAYPEVVPGWLPDERVLVGVVDVEHPVVADDGEDGEERGHVELDLELGLVAGGVGAVGGALDVSVAAVGPRLVEDLDGAGGGRVERVGGARVGAVLGLEPGGEARDLVPAAHVALQVEVPHHLHGRSRRRRGRWRGFRGREAIEDGCRLQGEGDSDGGKWAIKAGAGDVEDCGRYVRNLPFGGTTGKSGVVRRRVVVLGVLRVWYSREPA